MNMLDKKTEMFNILQEYYDDYTRIHERIIQNNCENDLKLRNNITTIRRQEDENKIKDQKINELESDISKKNKQIYEYEVMIRKLEDKIHEMNHEKKEEGRFDILRVQANTIQEKENEIERLTSIINKNKSNDNSEQKSNQDKKILNVLDMIENDLEDDTVISIIKKGDKENLDEEDDKENLDEEDDKENLDEEDDKENLDEEDDKEDDKENLDENLEEEEEEEEDDDDYEILTYRKKEYWIKKGENPQYVYEVLDDDCLGDKLGVYAKGTTGKMKVILDKK